MLCRNTQKAIMEPSLDNSRSRVLTFVMTIEYNGFAYAGFQRQAATPRDVNGSIRSPSKSNASDVKKTSPRKRPNPSISAPKRATKARTPITVQQQIENVLEQWTNLSIAAMRVRGAGRTDKGVHATGQVVAFDVPLDLLQLKKENTEGSVSNGKEYLSVHALPLLQEAYRLFCSSRADANENKQSSKDEPKPFLDHWRIRRAISTRLPPDIAIRSIWIWVGDFPFEARQIILRKKYIYKLRFRALAHVDHDDGDNPTIHPICTAGPYLLRRSHDQNNVWICHWPLDEAILPAACQAFVGVNDFTRFVHNEEQKKRSKSKRDDEYSNIIDLLRFDVHLERGDDDQSTLIPPVWDATFTLLARGFRRQMVRNLVGCVVDVARGIKTVDDLLILLRNDDTNIIEANMVVNAAPACGLCLEHVIYGHNHFMTA